MPTWHELQEHARSKYTLSKDEDTWFNLLWSYQEGRSQMITVSRFECLDQEWIELRTFVCKEPEMAPRVALRKNEGFPLGALALDSDGDYLLIHKARLADLDAEEFELPLTMLASVADELEKQYTAKDDY
jgi:hypothetical protein